MYKYWVEYDDHKDFCAGEECESLRDAYAKAIEYYKERMEDSTLSDEEKYDYCVRIEEWDGEHGLWGGQCFLVEEEDLEKIGWR